jgi:hypothetical protein
LAVCPETQPRPDPWNLTRSVPCPDGCALGRLRGLLEPTLDGLPGHRVGAAQSLNTTTCRSPATAWLTWGRNWTGRCHAIRTPRHYTDNMDNTRSKSSAVRCSVFSELGRKAGGAWEADALPTELFPLAEAMVIVGSNGVNATAQCGYLSGKFSWVPLPCMASKSNARGSSLGMRLPPRKPRDRGTTVPWHGRDRIR